MDYSTELQEKLNDFNKMDSSQFSKREIYKVSIEVDEMKIKEYKAARGKK